MRRRQRNHPQLQRTRRCHRAPSWPGEVFGCREHRGGVAESSAGGNWCGPPLAAAAGDSGEACLRAIFCEKSVFSLLRGCVGGAWGKPHVSYNRTAIAKTYNRVRCDGHQTHKQHNGVKSAQRRGHGRLRERGGDREISGMAAGWRPRGAPEPCGIVASPRRLDHRFSSTRN